MPKQLVFGTIKSLHDLFTAVWIGGLLTTAITFFPTIKQVRDKSPVIKKISIIYHHRLRVIAVISMIVLWVTGVLLGRQSPAYAGFLDFSSTYTILLSVKHLVIFVMIIIALYRGLILGRKIEHFTANQQKLYAVLLMVNTLLGVGVIFLSGIGVVFGG